MEFKHTSVLLNETIDGLNIKENGIYVDCTLGGAGHSSEIIKRLGSGGTLIGIDQDAEAIEAATKRLNKILEEKNDRPDLQIYNRNYSQCLEILKESGCEHPDGILLDLGVSSYQLDNKDRGFSYNYDAPLDMRMDQRSSLSASDIVNNYSEEELYRIIKEYGEEKCARSIARRIVSKRAEKPIETTFELNDIIKSAMPAKMREKTHPSKRTYQAIRIECNNELGVLRDSLRDMMLSLKPGGRICVITFHSLEDRIVKNIMKTEENPCTCPPEFPVCVCGKKPTGKMITRKPITSSEEELENNNRAHSAKLRIWERGE